MKMLSPRKTVLFREILRNCGLFLVVTFKILLLITCISGVGVAADLTVNTPDDQNDVPAGIERSLREVIRDAAAGDRVIFDATIFGQDAPVITLGNEIVVSKRVIIDGGSLGDISIRGGGGSRLFSVTETGDLLLTRLTLTNGGGKGASQDGNGGAIYNNGNLSIQSCSLNENSADQGGAIYNDGSLSETLQVINSTIYRNTANDGSGGAIYNNGALTVRQSTLAKNTASNSGGALYNLKTLSLIQSTVAENVAALGGGLAVADGSRTAMFNNIIAGNGSGPESIDTDIGFTGSPSPAFSFTLTKPNLLGNNHSVADIFPEGRLVGTPLTPLLAELEPLADNGGRTKTMALIPGSPAINAGDQTSTVSDQRGLDFNRTLFVAPDLGAYELGVGQFSASGFTLQAFVDSAKTKNPDDFEDPDGSKIGFEISDDSEFNFTPSTSTIAGAGSSGFSDGSRESAEFSLVSGVAQDSLGNLFILDTGNHRIRMMTPEGVVSTIAGSGEGIGAFGLVNGIGSDAKFAFPAGIAVGPDDNIYVSDTINHVIRKITRPGIEGQAWEVSTLAGSGREGNRNGPGDSAEFNHPHGITLDSEGNVYVCDTQNHVIRMITPGGNVTKYAGTGDRADVDLQLNDCNLEIGTNRVTCSDARRVKVGMSVTGPNVPEGATVRQKINETTIELSISAVASGEDLSLSFTGGTKNNVNFSEPIGLVFNDTKSLFVTNRGNHTVSQIVYGPEGLVRTLAGRLEGFKNGNGVSARFKSPAGLTIDVENNLYVSDEFNHAVRKINTFTGAVTTVAGGDDPTAGFANGNPSESKFNCPTGLYFAKEKSLIVADTQNHSLRRILVLPTLIPGELGPVQLGKTKVTARLNAASYGLTPDTKYYFRWVSTVPPVNLESKQRSGQSFMLFDAPIISTEDASVVTATSANFNAVVDPKNSTTNLTFEFSDNAEMTNATTLDVSIDAASGAGTAVTQPIPQPTSPGEVIYFRAIATNGRAKVSGQVKKLDFPVATVETRPSTEVMTTVSQLNSVVNAKGSPLELTFEYSTESNLEAPWQVASSAGTGKPGYFDTSSGLDEEFNDPQGVAAEGDDVYVADRGNNVIRRVQADGVVSTFAGSTSGFGDGKGGMAKFDRPSGIVADDSGSLFVADEFNHRIRKIDISTRNVTTFAGSSTAGFSDGLGAAASFLYPTGLAIDSEGNIYVADTGNHRIRKISPEGEVVTLAGTGTQGFGDGGGNVAKFSSPRGVVVSDTGDIYVADTGNHRIRKISSTGVVSTVSGSGTRGYQDGDGGVSQFSEPTGVAMIGGELYVTDRGNHLIRRIANDGKTDTLAGTGRSGFENSPSEKLYPATEGEFNEPYGITADKSGVLWITEVGNYTLRKVFRISLPVSNPLSYSGVVEQASNVQIANLLAGTTYYYRAIGNNAIGRIQGEIQSFTTLRNQRIEVYGVGMGADGSQQLFDSQEDTITFDSTPLGFAVQKEFSIFNEGEVPLNVSEIRLPSGYLLTGGGGSVEPKESLTFYVTLAASEGGTFAGEIVIDSDDLLTKEFNIPISGIVINPPTVVTTEATMVPPLRMNASVNPEGYSTSVGFQYSTTREMDGFNIETLAGSSSGFRDGFKELAQFSTLSGIALDSEGNIYIADTDNNRIRKLDTLGEVTTFAGSGESGYLDGPGVSAMFNRPSGVVIDSSGVLFVTDTGNHRIRSISEDGVVETYAGSGEVGFTDGVPDAARFDHPEGIAIHSEILYIADSGNHRIRKINKERNVSTFAGSGIGGALDSPVALVVDDNGNGYVTERSSHHILKISPEGVVTQLAGDRDLNGFEGGTGAAARFDNPKGLAINSDILYVADFGNHRVRKISLGNKLVATFAGTGSDVVTDGAGDIAGLPYPVSLAAANNGDLYVGQESSTIRRIYSATVIENLSNLSGKEDLPILFEPTNLEAGRTYFYRAFAENDGGKTYGSVKEFVATSTPGFASWRIDQFGIDASDERIAGADADPNGDGISNLLKYAFHLDPEMDSLKGLPIVRNDGNSIIVSFTKLIDSNDLIYLVERSSDLSAWTPVDAFERVLSSDENVEQVELSLPVEVGVPQFFRVRVTLK